MYDSVTATVDGLTKGMQIAFSYPTGRKAADYLSTGHVLETPAGTMLRQSEVTFFVQYGAASITLFYAGPSEGGGTVTLRLPLVKELESIPSGGAEGQVLKIVSGQPAWGSDTGNAVTWDEIEDKPTFSSVAMSGSYDDLTNTPTLGNLAALDTVSNAQVAANAAIALTKLANVAQITAAGGNLIIPAGTLQSVLQALADAIDPAP